LTYRWNHPDPEMDRLQQAAAVLVEDGVARGPRLTEAWFC
jgi:hypothetical protein